MTTSVRIIGPTVVLLFGGWSQAAAQNYPANPEPPMSNQRSNTISPPLVHPDEVIGRRDLGFAEAEIAPDQQWWRTKKGKEYDRLPPEFQWDTAPMPVDTPYPVYPFELLRTQVAGKIRVRFIIGLNGRVIRADLDEAATPEFGLAVRAMLDRCRFEPAKKKDGTPAYAYFGLEYDFEPKGRSDVPVRREARFILSDLEKKPARILSPGDLDHPLKPLSRPPPAYPLALQKTMPAGEAEVEFFVDTGGNVQLPHIKSSSAPEFGYAAVQAVAAWRFEPPTKGGKSVVVRVVVPIGFEGRPVAAPPKP